MARNSHLAVTMLFVISLKASAEQNEQSSAELAQELTNPVADLISVPIQVNFDNDIGPSERGSRVIANIQPVIPFELDADWNLITRTIVPIINQENIPPSTGSQFGMGDINLSLFLSPKSTKPGGITWGVGPILLLPTATDSKLGARKWGGGPAAVALALRGPWTTGILANHIWSFAGDDDRADISNTFIQPFVAHTWPSAWTVSAQSESTYNWESEQWSVPVNMALSKLVMVGRVPVSLQGAVGYWLESPDYGPEGFRFRLQVSLVLPRRR